MEKRSYSKQEKKIKIRTFISMTLISIIIVIAYIIISILKKKLIIISLFIIFIGCTYLAYRILKYKEKESLNILCLDRYLSKAYSPIHIINYNEFKEDMLRLANAYVELLPIEETQEYMKNTKELLANAKFYAKISEKSEEKVEIFVKYDENSKLHYYEEIPKYRFFNKYSI